MVFNIYETVQSAFEMKNLALIIQDYWADLGGKSTPYQSSIEQFKLLAATCSTKYGLQGNAGAML